MQYPPFFSVLYKALISFFWWLKNRKKTWQQKTCGMNSSSQILLGVGWTKRTGFLLSFTLGLCVSECDAGLCTSNIPTCREDQTLVATRVDGSCCVAHICSQFTLTVLSVHWWKSSSLTVVGAVLCFLQCAPPVWPRPLSVRMARCLLSATPPQTAAAPFTSVVSSHTLYTSDFPALSSANYLDQMFLASERLQVQGNWETQDSHVTFCLKV